MIATEQAFISGTTLTQFLAAAYACLPGCKIVYNLYGRRQTAREVTDRLEALEKSEVVILGALPIDFKGVACECSLLGSMTICEAPVHKLSYADTQRLRLAHPRNAFEGSMVLHLTKLNGGDGTTRVFYSLYALSSDGCDSLQSVKLNVDNLVDSLQGFTKIASVSTRYLPQAPVLVKAAPPLESPSSKSAVSLGSDVEILAREKASLVERIVELTGQLRANGVAH